MIHNLVKAAHEIVFNRKISGLNSKNVQGAIDEVSRTVGYTVSKNLLNNTVTTQSANGVVVTVNADKSITINGTATQQIGININYDFKKGKKYIISGCPTGGANDTYFVTLFRGATGMGIYDYGEELYYTSEADETLKYTIIIRQGQNVNVTFYPMIRYASIEDDTYEPYVEDVQTQIKDLDGRTLTIKHKTITATSDANGNVYLALIDDYPNLINVRCSSHMTSAIGVIITQTNAYWGCRLVKNSAAYTPLGNTNVTLVISYLE